MKALFVFLLLLGNSALHAQQWVDQQYQYDSVLNIQYGTADNFNGTSTDLFMDVYTPKCANPGEVNNWPLILFVHGGGFVVGSKDDASIQDLCKSFAQRGYVTASISYRLGYIADDGNWTCNFPGYSCYFATDTAEWFRAYYRSVQDGKGALRYLVNRYDQFSIDTNNLFLAGESAGAFVALGMGLLDDDQERPPFTTAIADAPAPHANAQVCEFNLGETFTANIPRPDLGGIAGTIEPTNIDYTVKGIGNMYGGMFSDLLQLSDPTKPKPAIYSFHQPCDLIVPIDSREVYWGLDWCFTNGYGCYAVANTPVVHGSKTMRDWNTNNGYGYTISNQFTTVNFPYNYWFGQGSCVDQTNNASCHAYDAKQVRVLELANFFAPLVNSSPLCQTIGLEEYTQHIEIFPNPAKEKLTVRLDALDAERIVIFSTQGVQCADLEMPASGKVDIFTDQLVPGIYYGAIVLGNGSTVKFKFAVNP